MIKMTWAESLVKTEAAKEKILKQKTRIVLLPSARMILPNRETGHPEGKLFVQKTAKVLVPCEKGHQGLF